MNNEHSIIINKVESALVVTIPTLLTQEVISQLKNDLLDSISRYSVEHIICDFSGISILDAEEYDDILASFRMASLMGGKTVIVGLSPGIAAMIADFDLDTTSFVYGSDIEHGMAITKSSDI